MSDLIYRDGVIEALTELHNNVDVWEVKVGISEAIHAINKLPSAEAVHKPDYSYEADMVKRLRQAEAVSREDYNETDGVITIEKQNAMDVEEIKYIIIRSPNYTRYFYNEGMPTSAEAEPTVIGAKTFMRKEDFDKWAEDIKRQGENIICIPCDAEVVYTEAVKGWRTGKPSKQGKYMVTLDAWGHRFIDIMHYDKPHMPNREVDGACWYMSDDEFGDVVYDDKDILAWMPLPTPYKGGEDE